MEGLVHKWSDWFVQTDLHGAIPLPLPLFALHLGGDRLLMGAGDKDNKALILADRMPVVCREYSVGWILHYNIVPPWPPNFLLAVIIPFSENKLEFAAAKVQATDGPLAMALYRTQGPSMACNDPCMLPTSQVHTDGTVLIGFSFADVLAGVLMCVQDGAIDFAASLLGGMLGDAVKKPLTQALEDGVEKYLGEMTEDAIEDGLEELLGENAEGVVQDILGGWVGNGAMELNSAMAGEPPGDTFTSLSNGIDRSTGGVTGAAETNATSMLLGGPLSPFGAPFLLSQSEQLQGD